MILKNVKVWVIINTKGQLCRTDDSNRLFLVCKTLKEAKKNLTIQHKAGRKYLMIKPALIAPVDCYGIIKGN